jgi:hypothetical protein
MEDSFRQLPFVFDQNQKSAVGARLQCANLKLNVIIAENQ